MKPIRFSSHALDQMRIRGATEEEVMASVCGRKWNPVRFGRLECQEDFAYNDRWNGRCYRTKRVRAIIVEEESEIVVITVYTYFF